MRNSLFFIRYSCFKGQSLIEILIGISALSIFVVGAVLILVSVLQVGQVNRESQTADDLASELLEGARALAATDWRALYASTTKGSGNHYHVTSTNSGLAITGNDETLVFDGITYTRWFYLENVCREDVAGVKGVGDITGTTDTTSCPAGSTEDPSTQKVVVTVNWPKNTNGRVLSEIVTRFGNTIFEQGSWRGGEAGESVTEKSTTTFTSSDNIDFSSSTGAIQLLNP